MKTVQKVTAILWLVTALFSAFSAGLGAANSMREAIRLAAEDEGVLKKTSDKLKAHKNEAK